MNLQQQEQFYQVMNRVKGNWRTASTTDARGTEKVNGLLVSKSLKKEPEVIDLQEYPRSAVPVQGINKLKGIQEFFNSNGRIWKGFYLLLAVSTFTAGIFSCIVTNAR